MALRFRYARVMVPPVPGVPGSDITWEARVEVFAEGPSGRRRIRGLIDTAAGITVLPIRYRGLLGVETAGAVALSGFRGDRAIAPVGRVNFSLRDPAKGAVAYRWSAVVAFDEDRATALWGRVGFLDHFIAMFHPGDMQFSLAPLRDRPLPPHVEW